MLGEQEEDIEEAPLIVPVGFQVVVEPPSEEALTFSKQPTEASQALTNRRIIQKWEGYGWLMGVIMGPNDDARRSIDGAKVNFWVKYDGEEEELPHVLIAQRYNTASNAEYDSWMLLDVVGAEDA